MSEDLKLAREARNRANRLVKQAKEDYIKEKLENDNAKNSGSKLLPKKVNNCAINLIDQNEVPIPNEQTADFINNFFVNIGEELAEKFDPNDTPTFKQMDIMMDDITTNKEEIIKLCSNININKSSAIDYLSSRILKDTFTALVDTLVTCFNLSFSTGIFPNAWKLAKITPLYKGVQKKQINNLRPISLLPLPGKLIEKIVHSRITSYLDTNNVVNILNANQNGFRANHSTEDTVAEFTDDISFNINKNKCTLATFIDFRKAFDTVIHNILLQKLNSLGIKNKTFDWPRSYLYERKQQVSANGHISKQGTITCDVPQGSTLGPLLFLLYINNINTNFLNAKIKLFADDTVLYTTSPVIDDAREQLHIDLDILDTGCRQHNLSINIGKTKSVLFGTKKFNTNITCSNLTIAGEEIMFVDEYKYLGIILDKHLSFTKHIRYVQGLAAHKIYMLSKIRPCITQSVAIRIYKTKVLPYFDQGDILFIDAFKKDTDKLQKLQNRALRICLNTKNRQMNPLSE